MSLQLVDQAATLMTPGHWVHSCDSKIIDTGN